MIPSKLTVVFVTVVLIFTIFYLIYLKAVGMREYPITIELRQASIDNATKINGLDRIKGWTADESTAQQLPLCKEIQGKRSNVQMDFKTPAGMEEIEQEYSEIKLGGYWKPKACISTSKLAVIVPYRDRSEHMRGFLHHIHGFLQHQQLEYAVFIVEQADNLTFNRGKLLNIGFVEALRFYNWQCFVFHDIDSLPENDLNLYSCPENAKEVKYLVSGFEKLNYKLPYDEYFSGAIIFTAQQYRRVNGYSNDFWGWGGEDDDLYSRVNLVGLNIKRAPNEIGRYKQFAHGKDRGNPPNPCRFKQLKLTKAKQPIDGLTNLRYSLRAVAFNRLYTHIKVDLLEDEFKHWNETFLRNC